MKTSYILRLPKTQIDILFDIAVELGFNVGKGDLTIIFYRAEKSDLEILWEIFREKYMEIIG